MLEEVQSKTNILQTTKEGKDNDITGIVIGVTKPGYITFEGTGPVGLGEYVTINGDQEKILGVVESCLIKSDALDDISNFEEALESKAVEEINKRDRKSVV